MGCILVMTCSVCVCGVYICCVCVCVTCVFTGMSELDYGLYPSREMQLEWLRVYLQAYKLSTKKGEEVSDRELERLYVQVNKFALVRNTHPLSLHQMTW